MSGPVYDLCKVKIHYGPKLEIPEINVYRESSPNGTKIKLNEKPLFGSPAYVLIRLVHLGIKNRLFHSGSWVIGKLVEAGIRRYWDYPDRLREGQENGAEERILQAK